jgi:hypothetical protein
MSSSLMDCPKGVGYQDRWTFRLFQEPGRRSRWGTSGRAANTTKHAFRILSEWI